MSERLKRLLLIPCEKFLRIHTVYNYLDYGRAKQDEAVGSVTAAEVMEAVVRNDGV